MALTETKTWVRRQKYEVGIAPVRIANNAPGRKSMLIQNIGGTTIHIDTDADVAVDSGIELLAGGSVSFTLTFDFALTAHVFWAISEAAGGSVEVWQTVESRGDAA